MDSMTSLSSVLTPNQREWGVVMLMAYNREPWKFSNPWELPIEY
jgi:hypothetical protein